MSFVPISIISKLIEIIPFEKSLTVHLLHFSLFWDRSQSAERPVSPSCNRSQDRLHVAGRVGTHAGIDRVSSETDRNPFEIGHKIGLKSEKTSKPICGTDRISPETDRNPSEIGRKIGLKAEGALEPIPGIDRISSEIGRTCLRSVADPLGSVSVLFFPKNPYLLRKMMFNHVLGVFKCWKSVSKFDSVIRDIFNHVMLIKLEICKYKCYLNDYFGCLEIEIGYCWHQIHIKIDRYQHDIIVLTEIIKL